MKKLLLSFLFVSITILGFAQISMPSTPPSFVNALLQDIPIYELPMVNEAELRAEDILEQKQNKSIPLRFGMDFSVELDLNNSGVWETLPNGDEVWRLRIESSNAKSLNFIFSDFYMPKGSEFFIYNLNKTYLIGAFTELNNKNHSRFSTAPVKGNIVILEYYEPKSVSGEGRIEVSKIIHAYRDMFATANDYIQSLAEDFGSSGSCNVDINCVSGNNWQDEKRSIAMVLTNGNTRWCSGAMVNNTAQDTTPYFLTGQHCLDGNEATWVFIFNYESPNCNGVNGNLMQSISGSTTRANYQQTDLALLTLSVKPPDDYIVYYAGWNRSNIPNAGNVAIHHPSGDVKKISVDNDLVVNGQAYNADHWRVENWEVGTTEGGSSGSPLFDVNHRIIGQLHGGLASCSNSQYDEFGKFSVSWLGGGTNGTQLKHWLDFANTNAVTLDGQYFTIAAFSENVKIKEVRGLNGCGNVFYPTVIVENLGSNAITNLEIEYQYAGYGPQIIYWTGNLTWLQTIEIPIPGYSFPIGNHSLSIDISALNVTDEDPLDNSITNNFTVTTTNSNVIINLQTDSWPEEIDYRIEDNNGNTVFQVFSTQITGSAFENTLLTENICLPSGCYQAIIEDDLGDGLSGGFGSNPGYFEVVSNDSSLGIINGNFGTKDTVLFCLPNGNIPNEPPVSIKSIYPTIISIDIFPNPSTGFLQFETAENIIGILIFDVIGRRVGAVKKPTTNRLDLSKLESGIYIIQFQFEEMMVNRKIIVN
ncbi:MAG: lysyl endopeptidase [Cognaticolwellia sp.]|jgi:lysyl endopeptidase